MSDLGASRPLAFATRAALAAPVAALAALPLSAQSTTRVSVASDGTQGNHWVWSGLAISADARFVAFPSQATNLVPGDVNNNADIFVHDRLTAQTVRVTNDGGGLCEWPSLSADGRFVAYISSIESLVLGDTNAARDAFVYDRQTGVTSRVSVATGGGQGNGHTRWSSISGDGRFVAFASEASNLVPGDTNGASDVFVRDRQTLTTIRVSVGPGGAQADGNCFQPAISADGRFVAFESIATNLVPGDSGNGKDVFVHDLLTGATECVSVNPSGAPSGWNIWPSISADGRFVAFDSTAADLVPGDTNGTRDIFVRDRLLGRTERVNVSSSGQQTYGWPDYSDMPAISGDGRCVAFRSTADYLVPGGNGGHHVFLRDRHAGRTERISVASDGTPGTGGHTASVSHDGRHVAFQSEATDLVPGDTNGWRDAFVRDRGAVALCLPAVYVDCAYAGVESGTFDEPFDTLAEALLAVCSGGEIVLKASTCTATPLAISTPLTLKSTGGPNTIR